MAKTRKTTAAISESNANTPKLWSSERLNYPNSTLVTGDGRALVIILVAPTNMLQKEMATPPITKARSPRGSVDGSASAALPSQLVLVFSMELVTGIVGLAIGL